MTTEPLDSSCGTTWSRGSDCEEVEDDVGILLLMMMIYDNDYVDDGGGDSD